MPIHTVGLSSRLSYKGADISFLVTGAFGHMIYNSFEVSNSRLNGWYNNLDVDYWTEDNPTNAHPKPDWTRSNPLFGSTRGYYPGDFIKIKNVQFGYSLPKSLLSKANIKKLRVYLNFNSPFIWSHLPGNLDPEVYGGLVGRRNYYTGHGSDVPSIRISSVGLTIEL
jgi:hypothetical protein